MFLTNFDSENLALDWIGFNIQGFVDPEPIANYLFRNFGFKSIIKTQFTSKRHHSNKQF